jgi:FixJ family two-component response regulator
MPVAVVQGSPMMTKQTGWIAVLDDDASVRGALMNLFATTAYKAKAYSSAEEFLAVLNGERPHCLLADFQMPKMTGLQLHIHLRQIGIQIPIIIMTAHDEPKIREICMNAGTSAFLPKPIRKRTLLAAIEQAIAA